MALIDSFMNRFCVRFFVNGLKFAVKKQIPLHHKPSYWVGFNKLGPTFMEKEVAKQCFKRSSWMTLLRL